MINYNKADSFYRCFQDQMKMQSYCEICLDSFWYCSLILFWCCYCMSEETQCRLESVERPSSTCCKQPEGGAPHLKSIFQIDTCCVSHHIWSLFYGRQLNQRKSYLHFLPVNKISMRSCHTLASWQHLHNSSDSRGCESLSS